MRAAYSAEPMRFKSGYARAAADFLASSDAGATM